MPPKTVKLCLPRLYKKQYDAVYDPKRIAVIFASTKSGKSVAALVWILDKAWSTGKAGHNFYWVSPTYGMARVMFRRLCRYLLQADPAQGIWSSSETELCVLLVNGARIFFRGSDNVNSLYGDDAYAAVIDEGSRQKEEAYHAVRSLVTATRGPIRILGNMRGRGNWQYRLWLQGTDGTAPDIGSHLLTCHDAVEAGVLNAEEIESARRSLPPAVFDELYECKPTDDGANPFGLGSIEKCIIPELSDKPPVVYGCDLAKSVDFSVLIGLDEDGAVCDFHRWNGIDWSIQIDRIIDVVGNTKTLLDLTSIGNVVLDNLKARAYERGINIDIEGLTFTSQSKQSLMIGLASALQQQRIHFPEGVIVGELRAFEFEYTPNGGVCYSAPSGMHDDAVCALALAVRSLQTPRTTLRIRRLI